MNFLKIKHQFIALSLVVFSSFSTAANYDYTLTWSSSAGTTTGGITFNTLSIPAGGGGGGNATIPSYVSAFFFTLNGQTYSLTSPSPISGVIARTTSALTLDPSSAANIKSSFSDINLFTFVGGPNCSGSNTTPQGYSPNVVRTCSGSTAIDYTLLSVIYGSGTFGPSVADTNQSLINSASVLQGTFTLQNSILANSFSYDCSLFGQNGVCVSAGGRNTAVQAANGLNNTSGLLITSYRLSKNNSRIGAYVDQNLSVTGPGTVQLGNNTPLIGLFGVWSERPDGVGAEVKVSAAYGQKSATVNRQAVGTSEAGSGGSDLVSQGAQVVGKYGFAVLPDTVVSPYVGMRYTQNNMGGYTEGASSTVTAPLTYGALNTNATTALAGAEARYRGIPQTTLLASAGVETDTNTANGSYNATNASIGTLTPVNFNSNPVRTRPTATVGAFYDVAKNQRLGVTGIYRQEAYQAVSTTTVMATYTVGL